MKIEHTELGQIVLKENIRAKRITVRFKDGMFILTHPLGINISYIKEALERMKPELLKMKSRNPLKIINSNTKIETLTFRVEIIKHETLSRYYSSLSKGILAISCPADTNFENDDVQQKIQQIIITALRHDAKSVLPAKVAFFAEKYNFQFNNVSINKSRTRWGSCSSKKRINLSCYCLLLPEHLIDFIIKHELCHTIEMNHGDNFWRLLDSITDKKAHLLTNELKKFKTSI